LGDLVVGVADAQGAIGAEEARLVAQIATGDSGAATAELYRRYSATLYRFGLHLLGDHGLAEEMIQECFVKLWRTAGQYEPSKASVGAYLFVIARSVAADIRKRPSSRPLLPLEEAREPPHPDDVDQLLDALIVHEAFDALKPPHALVLHLAQNAGMTQSEIARELNLPLGTVKTRMFYGMQAMRSALAERGINAHL
jgi:RNA polymerase sigma-70 factor, ECF subfamily